jgi:hypothetical protein
MIMLLINATKQIVRSRKLLVVCMEETEDLEGVLLNSFRWPWVNATSTRYRGDDPTK